MTNDFKDKLISILFAFILIIIMILNIIKKDDKMSYTERRQLEQFPKITLKSIFDKTLADKLDKYTTDQFIRRDNLRKTKVNIEMITKNNYNNLYIYNDYIIKELYPLDEKSVINMTNKINYIKNNYLSNKNIYYSIIPDKNYFINKDNLKLDYNNLKDIMNKELSDINYIDLFDTLKLDDYYKTDTHWKQESLNDVVNKLSISMNFNVNDNYVVQEASSCFKGVYSGQILISDVCDKINILENSDILNSTLYNYETNKFENIYDMSKVNNSDAYEIYLSGSASLLTIINNNNNSNKNLIVFRDSYGSSLIPLLISGYNKITVVDTRYINPKLLNNYIDFNDYQDTLFIYNTMLINESYSLK